MTKILVPADFTKVSLSALRYAMHLADKIKGKITILHVINGNFSSSDAMFLNSMDELYETAKKRLNFFVNDDSVAELGLENIKIEEEVRFGVPGFTIADFANDQNFDYVVTGMRDNHSMLERFLGTTSAIVTKLTSCPVILIHENTKWMDPKKVIFAIDNNTDFDESIDTYLSFNANFKAATDFIHIKKGDEAIDANKDAVIRQIFESKNPDFTFEFNNIDGGDIIQTIVDYSIFSKSDMLVLVHRKRKLLDSIFNKSISLQTAEGLHLPIMILEENAPD